MNELRRCKLNTQKDDYGLHLQKVNDTEPIKEKMP